MSEQASPRKTLADPVPADPVPADPVLADPVLVAVVREIEEHAAGRGWDQPASLFALVPTSDLLAREPGLAAAFEIDEDTAAESLTPVEQEALAPDRSLERTLEQIMWPDEVAGCAVVVERLVLPPSVDGQIPDDDSAALDFAAEHPDRQEVRFVAAALRTGATFCALRLRTHDDAFSVLEGPDLVPALLQLLSSTLEQ
ncbi:MAG: PPA1309 family protein [Nocardioides sp.]